MRIISTKTLGDFWAREPDAEQALRAWIAEARHAQWDTPSEVRAVYCKASILQDGRVVFNICGNRFRLVVWVNYQFKTIYVRFVGTHQEYDAIDAQTI